MMGLPDRSRPRVVLAWTLLGALASCAAVKPATTPPDGSAAPDRPQLPPDSGKLQPDAASCTVECVLANGRYCGTIGDNCNGMKDCGPCPADQVCEKGLCVGGPSCPALTCPAATTVGSFCGTIGDGCGRALDCGACGATNSCTTSGVCVQANCVPLTCNIPSGGQYCGKIGDGCGGALDCSCTGTATCGGGGVPGVCGSSTCATAVSCMPAGGGRYCGRIGNGCGGVQECGACPGGATCTDGVCPGSTTTTCQRLQCLIPPIVPACAGAGVKTTLSGVVRDPAGKIPIYNAVVYVPNAALEPVREGVSCDRCSVSLSGSPVAVALTDADGRFRMEDVPTGANIPLVIQVGKWRREAMVPNVASCADTAVDPELTRLPRNKAEGHLPKIAVTTGGADALECLLRRFGIADSEFTTDAGVGRVNLFAGGDGTSSFSAGGAFPAATTLWSDPAKLASYDVALFSCEGTIGKFESQKPQTSVDNVANYANGGGRLFLSHEHYTWLQKRVPDFSGTADYIGGPTGGLASPPDGTALGVNQSFPKGAAFAQWLNGPNVAASTTLGQFTANGIEHSVTAVHPPTTEWVYLAVNPKDAQKRRSEQYLSFNTPVGWPEDMQCGRVVFTDIHMKVSGTTPTGTTGGDDSSPNKPFPTGCLTNELSPQAKALEFLFFDLSACVQSDTTTPVPPVLPPPGVPMSPPPSVDLPPGLPPPPPPPPPPIIP